VAGHHQGNGAERRLTGNPGQRPNRSTLYAVSNCGSAVLIDISGHAADLN